jgi:hypothetical protein
MAREEASMRKRWPLRILASVAIAAAGAAWAADTGDANESPGNGSADEPQQNTGPSPRDAPAPSLRPDDRLDRMPSQRGDKANPNGGVQPQERGNGDLRPVPKRPSQVRPANPSDPATPIFPANPHPPADPGEPGNPVTPTSLHFA